MTTTTPPQPPYAPPRYRTAADWLRELGDVPPERILFDPTPGTATEADLLRKVEVEKQLCELVNGTLVEKPVGLYESQVATWIGYFILQFISGRRLGIVTGGDGPMRLKLGLVRLPDVSFISADRLKTVDLRQQSIPSVAPDLAVEVLSKSNTQEEIARKISEYFAAGVRLVWIVDPVARSAVSYDAPHHGESIASNGALDGADVLPGFQLSLAELFRRVDENMPMMP